MATEPAYIQTRLLSQEEDSMTTGRRGVNFQSLPLINNGTVYLEDLTEVPSVDVRMRPFDFEHFCSESLTFSWECTSY